jgi:hypothetical protein
LNGKLKTKIFVGTDEGKVFQISLSAKGKMGEIAPTSPHGGVKCVRTCPLTGNVAASFCDGFVVLFDSTGKEMESKKLPRKIFIVHGHDNGSREAVPRFVEKIGCEAMILHELPNQGRTVIEKVEAHGDVSFAVVLLTPDDVGCKAGESTKPRPRQNVLLELGYFIGRLGRANVCTLATTDTMDLPTDFAGVVWEAFDSSGGWKSAIGRELQAVGFDIDWNKVMNP